MPNVAQLIRDHVTLEVECVDRLYLNGYIPTLQEPGQLVCFLTQHRGHPIPSPKLLGDIIQGFHKKVKRFAKSVGIPRTVKKLEGKNRYVLTPQGRRWALFFTKSYARIFRPAFQMLEPAAKYNHPAPLVKIFGALERAVDHLVRSAKLAA